jgi:hypothetical protein
MNRAFSVDKPIILRTPVPGVFSAINLQQQPQRCSMKPVGLNYFLCFPQEEPTGVLPERQG